jgi:anti-anti-sigma factor
MTPADFEPTYFQLHSDGELAVAIFAVPRLTDEDNVEQLGHELNAIVDKLQCRRVILDLNSVEYATSSVIGKWIMLHRKLDREGGKMVLCGISPTLADILGTAKLLNYFTVTEDAESARNACHIPAPTPN